MSDIETMLDLKTWAVVGATNHQDKFGYKIFKFLDQTNEYAVFPVNPGLTEVLGHKCYPSVKELPSKPDVVNFVVPAKAGEQVVRDCAEAGIRNIWLQPGADAPSVVNLANELGLTVVKACVLVELRKRGL